MCVCVRLSVRRLDLSAFVSFVCVAHLVFLCVCVCVGGAASLASMYVDGCVYALCLSVYCFRSGDTVKYRVLS